MNDSISRKKKGKGGCRSLAALAVLALTGCGLGSLPPVSASNAAALCRLAHSRLDSDAPEQAAKALERCSDPAFVEPWLEEYASVKELVKAQRAGKARP